MRDSLKHQFSARHRNAPKEKCKYYYISITITISIILLLLLCIISITVTPYCVSLWGPLWGPLWDTPPIRNKTSMGPCTVSFQNLKSRNFKLSVSNPESKSVACLSVLSQISNCQSLGRKNKFEILKTDRKDPKGTNTKVTSAQRSLLCLAIHMYVYICIYIYIYVYV